jgi:Protein of unknown function (DUF3467)
MTDPVPVPFSMQVPDALVPGVYSNVVGVWHTPYEFTLDFAVLQPTQQGAASARVVSRVRIPPAAVFELMRALSTNEALYVQNVGPIRRPGPDEDASRLYPPEN